MSNKKILLICYSFPPFAGIGGRRWAKFSKSLTMKGFEIFVVGAEQQGGKPSNWTHDVAGISGIHYHPIKTKFYSFFHDHNFNFWKKVKYKLSKIYLENKFKGNFYDKALSSNELFYKKAKELIIKNDIKNLLITIAPNRLVDVGVRLKKEFPYVNFIYDIRDPWNICLDEWDHKFLSKEQKAFELKTELNAANTADTVFSVYQIVADWYKENWPEKKENFICIPNGFDKDEMNTDVVKKGDSSIKYFVYTGILYDISIDLFKEFLKQISHIDSTNTELLKQMEFHFYIPEQGEFKKAVAEVGLEKFVKFFDLVPLKQVHGIIANSIGCMLFLPPQFEFSLSTKFYEYVSYDKKILLFSNPGEVAKIIDQHQLGYVMLPGKMEVTFTNAMTDFSSGKELPKHTFPLEDYSIESLTNKIIPYFK